MDIFSSSLSSWKSNRTFCVISILKKIAFKLERTLNTAETAIWSNLRQCLWRILPFSITFLNSAIPPSPPLPSPPLPSPHPTHSICSLMINIRRLINLVCDFQNNSKVNVKRWSGKALVWLSYALWLVQKTRTTIILWTNRMQNWN